MRVSKKGEEPRSAFVLPSTLCVRFLPHQRIRSLYWIFAKPLISKVVLPKLLEAKGEGLWSFLIDRMMFAPLYCLPIRFRVLLYLLRQHPEDM